VKFFYFAVSFSIPTLENRQSIAPLISKHLYFILATMKSHSLPDSLFDLLFLGKMLSEGVKTIFYGNAFHRGMAALYRVFFLHFLGEFHRVIDKRRA